MLTRMRWVGGAILAATALAALVRAGQEIGRWQDAQARAELVAAAGERATWPDASLPPPGTPIRATTPFGRFTLPLANIAGRDEFWAGGGRAIPPPVPMADGSYDWASFSAAFWMPDGAGVLSDPGRLLSHTVIDATTLQSRLAPLRPLEAGRPDPDADHYVVVVGEFCPRDGSAPPGPHQGWSLTLTGYGGGAMPMYGCKAQVPIEGWTAMPAQGPNRSRLWCHDGWAVCFGWIDLPDDGIEALAYLPRDALDQAPRVAARLHALLAAWRREPAVQPR